MEKEHIARVEVIHEEMEVPEKDLYLNNIEIEHNIKQNEQAFERLKIDTWMIENSTNCRGTNSSYSPRPDKKPCRTIKRKVSVCAAVQITNA